MSEHLMRLLNQQFTTTRGSYSLPLSESLNIMLLPVLQPSIGESLRCCLHFSEGAEMWTPYFVQRVFLNVDFL